uniref:SFRICE_039843 n=1 Tax=Spodoptera frugiperda TaxID=7108 RepID=A0A2H1X017_SPOFR
MLFRSNSTSIIIQCQYYTTPIVAVKPFRVRNIKPNSIPFSSFNIHAMRMQWALVLQLKSTFKISMSIDRNWIQESLRQTRQAPGALVCERDGAIQPT